MQVDMTVNGQARSADVEARTLLVYYIRDAIGLTGTNVGCDTSSCGACTVLLDVTTIEGLADGTTLHPMQQAFMDCHGLQCGYCTPGMVLAATSLLRDNPSPTESEVREGLEGNLCRCTGYHNIVKAVLSTAEHDAAFWQAQARTGAEANV